REQLGARRGAAVAIETDRICTGAVACDIHPGAVLGRRGAAIRARLREARCVDRAEGCAFLEVDAVPNIAWLRLDGRRTAERRDRLLDVRRVRVELDRQVRPIDGERAHAELVAMRLHLADVVELRVAKSTRHRELARDEQIVDDAVPRRAVHSDAITPESGL